MLVRRETGSCQPLCRSSMGASQAAADRARAQGTLKLTGEAAQWMLGDMQAGSSLPVSDPTACPPPGGAAALESTQYFLSPPG